MGGVGLLRARAAAQHSDRVRPVGRMQTLPSGPLAPLRILAAKTPHGDPHHTRGHARAAELLVRL